MLFNSTEFAVFFVAVYSVYWALRRSFSSQNLLLLAASYLFYGWWDVRFLFLIILTTTVDFWCALLIGRGRASIRQRAIPGLFLVAAAFFCVTVQWAAVDFGVSRMAPRLTVNWKEVLPGWGLGWQVLIAAAALALAFNLAYPWLSAIREQQRRKLLLTVSICTNLGVLGFFKYYNFFAASFADLVQNVFGFSPGSLMLSIILPVGISFYTFQSMSYTVDVFRAKMAPAVRFTDFATYLAFFPQLVAGPIERGAHLLPQFQRPRTVSSDDRRYGIWLIWWGLFKKLVVADNMAVIVNSVFSPYDGANPSNVPPADGLRLLIGVYAFALQIYGDFSGYTDIARGTARLLGFDVMLNFNLPYFAISPSDFWKRWHISLSSWLRDYLYIPLGGNRGGSLLTCRNLLLTMLLGGLWHGAHWTFVIWGLYHGLLLIGYRLVAPGLGDKVVPPCAVRAGTTSELAVTTYGFVLPMPGLSPQLAQRVWIILQYVLLALVMFHFTCLGWLIFRAQNVTTIRVFLQAILGSPQWSPEAAVLLKQVACYSWFLILFQAVQALSRSLNPMGDWHWFVRLNVWIIVIMSLFRFSARAEQAFIYFAF